MNSDGIDLRSRVAMKLTRNLLGLFSAPLVVIVPAARRKEDAEALAERHPRRGGRTHVS